MSATRIIQLAQIYNNFHNLPKEEQKVLASRWNKFSPKEQSNIIEVGICLENLEKKYGKKYHQL